MAKGSCAEKKAAIGKAKTPRARGKALAAYNACRRGSAAKAKGGAKGRSKGAAKSGARKSGACGKVACASRTKAAEHAMNRAIVCCEQAKKRAANLEKAREKRKAKKAEASAHPVPRSYEGLSGTRRRRRGHR